ncbi:MAG: glycosyltransferase [Chloroflexi bacterium]|nr:MAG: glycosyltransferase [Chloroflexota bacterium]
MRILISSNGHHTPTGYGVQTAALAKMLRDLGHEVAIYAWYGLSGSPVTIGGFPTYPRVSHHYGGDAHIPANHWRADIVITIQDLWVLPDDFADKLERPWIAWFPVDGDPIPPDVAKMAKTAAFPLAMSRHGRESAKAAGIRNAGYIPHAVDTAVFKPVSDERRQKIRQYIGIDDETFLAVMVAANKGFPSRKSFPEVFQAFALFHERHPDSLLYVHAEYNSPIGMNLHQLRDLVGLPETAVRFPPIEQYKMGFPHEYVAQIYQAADVLLSPSMGEGFGIPIVEAQACGCPVITQNVTSMPEITINGIAVNPIQRVLTGLGHWQYLADPYAIADAMFKIQARSEHEKIQKREKGIAFANNFSTDALAEYWRVFLNSVEAAIKEPVHV